MKKPQPGDAAKALAHFKRIDPVLHRAAKSVPKDVYTRVKHMRTNDQLFAALAGSVVSQQLATKAAASIWKRVQEVCGGRVTVEAIATIPLPRLRKAGLSAAKAKTLKELAKAVRNGLYLPALRNVPQEAALEKLTAVWGIGPWTVEMFLIFALGRPDIFSSGDLGLVRAVEALYGLPKGAPRVEIERRAALWAPYRSYACLVLWYSRDGE